MQEAGRPPAARAGLGFNPNFPAGHMPVPGAATYIEAGIEAICASGSGAWLKGSGRRVSLHLSRAPFCEDADIQRAFARRLAAALPPWVASVGLHLCGPYRRGLGIFGLGSSFPATPRAAQSAHALMDALSAHLAVPIAVENANFYDADSATALRVTRFLNSLARCHGAAVILDLAHLAMNAANAGADPRLLLGAVDLDLVEVVHLSGLRQGRDGLMHDAHDEAVAPQVWALLETVRPLLPDGATLVLEHTDPAWRDRTAAFSADFARVLDLASAAAVPPPERDQARIAIGYLARILLPARFPELARILGPERFAALVAAWADAFLAGAGSHEGFPVLRAFDRGYLPESLDVAEAFGAFLQQGGIDGGRPKGQVGDRKATAR